MRAMTWKEWKVACEKAGVIDGMLIDQIVVDLIQMEHCHVAIMESPDHPGQYMIYCEPGKEPILPSSPSH